MLGKQAAVPAAVAGRRRLIERFQDALFSGAGVFTALCYRARIIVKGRDSIPGKSPQPLAHPRSSGLHLEGDLLTVHSAGSQKNHSRPLDHTLFALGTSHPTQKRLFLLSRKQDLRSRSAHITRFYRYYAIICKEILG